MTVRLTRAVSLSTMTGMAKLKKQFLKDSNPYPPTTLINSRATLERKEKKIAHNVTFEFKLESFERFFSGKKCKDEEVLELTSPDTAAVAVAMAGMIFPAMRLVFSLSAGSMEYILALREDADVTKSMWPLLSLSFSNWRWLIRNASAGEGVGLMGLYKMKDKSMFKVLSCI